MGSYISRIKKIIFFFFFSFAIFIGGRSEPFTSLWSDAHRFSAQISSAVSNQMEFFVWPVHWITRQDSLSRKLMESELLNRQLDARIVKLQYIQRENEDLRSSLASMSGSRFIWVPAHLFSQGNDFYIDVGIKDGVAEGSEVLSSGVYIGVTTDVQPSISKVIPVSSSLSRIGVRTVPSQVVGVLSVTTRGLIMTSISRADTVHEGDVIETMGDGHGIEGGILIGHVDKDLTRTSDPISSFHVRAAFDTNNINSVIVRKAQ